MLKFNDSHSIGYPGSYGLFQDYYSNHAPFAGSPNIAVIGALAMGLMYLSAPLVFGIMHAYPHTKRPCILIGLIVMSLALGLGSLSQTVPQLLATQGIFYAIGGSLVYSPTVQFMDDWFVQRKGLAFGALCVCSLPSQSNTRGPQYTDTELSRQEQASAAS